MKIISFNVNSVRLRLHQLQVIVENHQPQIIGLQETKVQDHDYPFDAIKELGYESIIHGEKTHRGVALLTNLPIIESACGLDIGPSETQTRLIYCKLDWLGRELHVFNGYFPQGDNLAHPTKFSDKRSFYADLLAHLQKFHNKDEEIIVMGDLNVAPQDIDIGIDHPESWLRRGACSFLPEERDWLNKLYEWGLSDSYRYIKPEGKDYSWFDYRTRAFDRSHKPGLRIDHILLTPALLDLVKDSGVDYPIRAMEKPSDHVPVWTEISR